MIIIGITGSIGMGKSTVAEQFKALGAHGCDADKLAHRLMQPEGKAFPSIVAHFPEACRHGSVDRSMLGSLVFKDGQKRAILESILHPLVVEEEEEFIREERRKGVKIVALEIPLLFETGADRRVDLTVVASAPAFIQERRVMARKGMTKEKYLHILKAQMPNHEKQKHADIVITTGLGRAYSFKQVRKVVAAL